MLSTPWGPAATIETITPGLLAVTTASHGGLLVSQALAEQHLSPAAIARGLPFAEGLAYEEDVAWLIVAWETPAFWPWFFPWFFRDAPPAERRDPAASLLRSLSAWHSDYLIERGLTPDAAGYRFWRVTGPGRAATIRRGA